MMENCKGGALTRRAFTKGLAGGGLAWAAGERLASAAPGLRSAHSVPAAAGDWPTYRHDPGLTALSPLKGGFAERPRVAWSLDLGGPAMPAEQILVVDVTGDGKEAFLALGADAVVCRDATGKVLWRLDGTPAPAVLDIRDFAGDGSRGILLT